MSDINLPGAQANITANTSQFERAIGRAQSVLSGLEPIVATQWWGLQNLSRAFGAVGTAVASGFGLAVREAIAWESAMVGVQRTTQATPEQLDEIEAGLRKVANTTPIAVSELAALAEQAGALGVENTDIPEFVRIMGTLIGSTNLTANSAEDLARTMNVLGVPVEAFERFASTLLDVGRNTAATETEILNLARRLAPAARMAGFTADEVLGLSAAVISLGPRAEAGSSAITRAIGDISRAVAAGGDDLANWATVAGMSADQFARAWKTDASSALEQVILGLGKFEGNIVGLTSVLDHLDQSNVRNIITLGALASGITDVNNEQTSLIAINDLSREAWRNNTAMQQVAEARSKTFAAQLQIMQNRLAEIGNTIGAAVLPWFGRLLDLLQDMVAGFMALPDPLKFVLAAVVALIGGLSLLAGGVLALIGPLVLMMSSWRAISQVLRQAKGAELEAATGISAATTAVNAQTGAVARNTAVWIQNRNAQGRFAKGGQWIAQSTNAATTATTGLAAATPAAVTGVSRLWGVMSRLARIGAIVTTVLAGVSIALAFFGNKVRDAEKETAKKIKQDDQLVDALEQVRKGNIHAADSFILSKVAAADLLDATNRLRVSYASLVQIIKGSAPPQFAADTVKNLNAAADAGDKGARKILNFLATEREVYKESARAAGILSESRQQLGITNDDTAATESNLAKRTDEAREAQDKANQAAISYIDAVLSHRRAVMATEDALEEYTKTLSDAANPTMALARAENDLAIAQNNHREAQRDLAASEKELLTARQDQLDDLAEAEDDLADSNDRYLDSLDKISEIEERIAELRQGASSKDLLEATNKLANAHLALRAAEQSVEDAEWQLNFLRQEGASDRDIEEAEFALDKARQEVANQTEAVGEAEEDLSDLRDGFSEEIIDLERDLAKARRDSDNALKEIKKQEEAVRDLRDQVAGDTAYLDAQAKVAESHNRVFDALQRIRDAELELQNIRAGGLQKKVEEAQLSLEESLYSQAKAATAVQKEQAAMRGEFWDSGREAHALADNLSLLLNQAPTEETRRKMLEHINLLRKAVVLPPEAEPGGGGAGGAAPGVPTIGADVPGLDIKPEATQKSGKSIAEKIRSAIETAFSALVGGMVGRIVMILAATFLGITGGWAILAGIIVGALVSFVLDAFLKSELGQKIIDGLINGLMTAVDAVGRFFHYLWFDVIWATIKTAMGIGSPSKKMEQVGVWLIEGLLNGLLFAVEVLLLFFVELPSKILELLGGAGMWLVRTGGDIIQGLWNGAQAVWRGFWGFVTDIGPAIGRALGNSATWLIGKGGDAIRGLWNGMVGVWNEIAPRIQGIAKSAGDFFGGLYNNVLVGGKNVVIGFWNGLAEMSGWLFNKVKDFAKGIVDKVKEGMGKLWPFSPSEAGVDVGRGLGLGIEKGIKQILPTVEDSAETMASRIERMVQIHPDVLAQFDPNMFTDISARHAASSPVLAGVGAGTTTNTGDDIDVHVKTDADPHEIAKTISWEKRVRRR